MEIKTSRLTGEKVSVRTYDTTVRTVVPFPAAEGGKLLCASVNPAVSLCEALSGQIRVEGSVRCCVIGADAEQRLVNQSVSDAFDCLVPAEGLSPRARILAGASCCGVQLTREGSAAVVTAQIRIQMLLSDPAEETVVTQAAGESLYVHQRTVRSTENIGDYRARFAIREDIALSVRLPQVATLLCGHAAPVIRQVRCEADQILVQGTLAVNLIYACEDEFEPVAQVADSIEFNKMISAAGVTEADSALLSLYADDCRFTVEKNEDGEARIVSVDCVIAVTAEAYRSAESPVITDAYSTDCLLDLTRTRLTLNNETALFRSRQSARLAAQLPAENAPMARICAVMVSPCVERVSPAPGGAEVHGTALVQVLYIASETGDFASFSTVSEFSFLVDAQQLAPEMAIFAEMRPEQIQAVLTGAKECELHLTLAVFLAGFGSDRLSVLTEITEGEPRREDGGICVYMMQPGETLWDAGKTLGLSPDALRALNPDAGERPAAGTRLLAYRQTRE